MILGLGPTEERVESVVELDELVGRGAHIVWRHGGSS